MGDSEWQEITFSKIKNIIWKDLAKNLFLPSFPPTVYVSNISLILPHVPVNFIVNMWEEMDFSSGRNIANIRELWQICGKKGTLVDVYIAKHKNKLGQMFAFCRFITVSNQEVLINSLSNIWIGKLRLHANMARFDRKAGVKSFHAGVKIAKSAHSNPDVKNSKSYANAAKTITKAPVVDGVKAHADGVKLSDSIGSVDTSPSINLNQDNGFPNVGIKYLGGLWVLFDFHLMDARIKFLKHEGVLSWFSSLKPWHDDFAVNERLIWIEVEGVSYAIRVRKLCSWTPTFVGEDSHSDDEDSMELHDEKKEEVSDDNDAESVVGDDLEQTINQFNDAHSPENFVQKQDIGNDDLQDYGDTDDKPKDTPKDSDPFSLEPLIMKNCGMASKPTCSTTLIFPPGFSPKSNGDIQGDYYNACNRTMLRLEETIKVGVALGFNMEGCENTFASLIAVSSTYGHSTSLNIEMPNRLSLAQCQSLEHQCSCEEIKKAVWDCGSDRTPGPNGFTFNFITSFWDLLEADVVRFMHDFFHSGTFPKGCNSSFISLIPKVPNAKFVSDFRPISLIGCQYKIIGKILANRLSTVIGSCVSSEQTTFIKGRNILDGPLILNEVIDYGKAWFRFEMTFWIHGCLKNARSSVLVNGSPTSKFELFKGLRQGDLLSPLLFILVMEGLHAITCKSVDLGLFRGVSNGRDNLSISDLMYVDDVIFLGEWSQSNIQNLLCMLRCFFLVLGLKINVQKSNISGVSVPDEDAADMAKSVGCGVANFPMKYLGVPVECNMSRCAHWNPIIQRFSSKLAQWKARLLSVGGRLSLIKSVLGNLSTYYMSIYLMSVSIQKKLESMRNNFFIGGEEGDKKITWVRWKKCLASKKLGGLGIGSIYALNLGLLFKWIWRFRCHSNDLWARVIKNVYGHNGGIHDDRVHPYSTWGDIFALHALDYDRDRKVAYWLMVRVIWFQLLEASLVEELRIAINDFERHVKRLKQNGIDLLALCVRKIENGVRTSFWNDNWCGNSPLKTLYPRIYMLYSDRDRKDVVLSDQNDSWMWTLNASTGFTVASTRSLIDANSLVVDSNTTRWNRSVPIKINVFLWRLALNKLPTRVNLDRKGIDIDSTLCPICGEDVETVKSHFLLL
ncbi:RNA-directed DNA polymerase, eukaryota [Tanacetum coccineum]